LQFFVANNDACPCEHKDHSKEVPLLLQWHLQFFLAYIEACPFLTCSFSSDQVLYLCFSPSDKLNIFCNYKIYLLRPTL
jgi:hypothetical protein